MLSERASRFHAGLLASVFTLAALAALTSPALAAGVRAQALGRFPLYFIPNRGQLELPAAFYVQGRDRTALFGPQGVTFVMPAPESAAPRGPATARKGIQLEPDRPAPPRMLGLQFLGSRAGVEPVGEDPSGAVFSWFHGTREQWKTGLPMYEKVIYPDLWPGIDLVYSGEGGRLKYSLVVQPGGDPGRIRLSYDETSSVALDKDGGLAVSTGDGSLREAPPVSFQEIDGRIVEVPTSFDVEEGGGTHEYGFRVGAYDRSLPLVIDPPTFVYAGFLGGIDNDRGLGIAVDRSGNAYITGQVNTWTPYGYTYDAYVAKINPGGTALVYYALLHGSREDEAFDIVVDGTGSAYITGGTASTDYPVAVGPDITHNGGWIDALVTKFSPSGTNLVFSGFLGGAGLDFAEGIAVDGSGNVYIEGPTTSDQHSLPVKGGPDRSHNGRWDTFIAKIKADPSSSSVTKNLWYCGYIGGSGDDAIDYGDFVSAGNMAIDSAGAAYINSLTTSKEDTFPNGRGFGRIPGFDQTQNGGFDAFLVKVKPNGKGLEYATYIGGDGLDFGRGIEVDSAGNAYFTGDTLSTESTFPVTVGPDLTYNGGDLQPCGDAYVGKLRAGGTSLEYLGYIGGSDCEQGFGLRVDASGSAVVAGYTESSESTFPVKGGPDLTFNGTGINVGDAYIVKVKPVPSDPVPANNLDYCGYIGGSGNDWAFWLAIDGSGNAYVVGDTESSEATFPDGDGMGGVPGWNQTWAGILDAFVVKISP